MIGDESFKSLSVNIEQGLNKSIASESKCIDEDVARHILNNSKPSLIHRIEYFFMEKNPMQLLIKFYKTAFGLSRPVFCWKCDLKIFSRKKIEENLQKVLNNEYLSVRSNLSDYKQFIDIEPSSLDTNWENIEIPAKDSKNLDQTKQNNGQKSLSNPNIKANKKVSKKKSTENLEPNTSNDLDYKIELFSLLSKLDLAYLPKVNKNYFDISVHVPLIHFETIGALNYSLTIDIKFKELFTAKLAVPELLHNLIEINQALIKQPSKASGSSKNELKLISNITYENLKNILASLNRNVMVNYFEYLEQEISMVFLVKKNSTLDVENNPIEGID
ncbi:MAG: hypothetical protein MHPSP_000935 [Paramarteilia canceri]